MSSKTAVLIPARYASSRLPEKMLKQVAGKPIVQWTYEAACSAFAQEDVHIITDHPDIVRIAQSFGAQVWMSPVECESGTERLCWALNHPLRGLDAQWIIGLQGDEPLLPMEAVQAALQELKNFPEAVLSTLSTPIRESDFENPHVVKCVSDRYKRALYFSRSPIPNPGWHKSKASVPLSAKRHVGLYVWQKDFLKNVYSSLTSSQLHQYEDLEQLKLLENGYRIQIASWPDFIEAGIDTYEDLNRAATLLGK